MYTTWRRAENHYAEVVWDVCLTFHTIYVIFKKDARVMRRYHLDTRVAVEDFDFIITEFNMSEALA